MLRLLRAVVVSAMIAGTIYSLGSWANAQTEGYRNMVAATFAATTQGE